MEKTWIVVSNSVKYNLQHPIEIFETAKDQIIQWGIPKTSFK